MRSYLFLKFVFVTAILFLGITICIAADTPEVITTGTLQDGQNGNLYKFNDEDSALEIKDSDDNPMLNIHDVEPDSTLELDEKGNLKKFKGTVNEKGSVLTVNYPAASYGASA